MQLNISKTDQASLDLPIPQGFAKECPRSLRMDLDHLLLAVEAIDLQGNEAMLYLVQTLQLEKVIPNRVSFWRIRNTNPMRRNYQRASLSWDEAMALVLIICALAKQLNTVLRLLISTLHQIQEGKLEALGLQQNQFYVEGYLGRFRSLYLSRMRSPSILTDTEIDDLAIHTLTQLLFCSGVKGDQRLWHSLLDGIVR